MGTRNLTMVYLDGEYRVAQYGQWDGYPEGNGLTALHFARDEMRKDDFCFALRQAKQVDSKWLIDLRKSYGASEDGMMFIEDADRFCKDYPQFSRDTGAKILQLIQSSHPGIALNFDIEFAADSLMCEWAWLIDLDKETFECYEGFNHTPLKETERFYFLEPKAIKGHRTNQYHPVKQVVSFSLNDLPTDEAFLAVFSNDEKEQEATQ